MFCFSACSRQCFIRRPSLNFSVLDHLKCCTFRKLNPVTESVIFREKTSTWLTVTKTKCGCGCGSGSSLNSPEELLHRCLTGFWMRLCFLVLAKVCSFIKKEMICLIFAFIDNIFFSIIQPSNSVNMTQKVGKIDMLTW